MTTFRVGHNLDYWIGYLHHYLTNNQLLHNLNLLEEVIWDIHSDKPDTTATTTFTNIRVCWKIWTMYFKILYPAFFEYLELGNLFRTGSLFLKAPLSARA